MRTESVDSELSVIRTSGQRETLAASVIIPTYCASEDLRTLVLQLHGALRNEKINAEFLIVDGGSSDKTFELCRELGMQYPLSFIAPRNGDGLSSAILDAIRQSSTGVFVVMDADLPQASETLLRLLHVIIADGADCVIGSRYVRGGVIDGCSGIVHRLLLRAAALPARPLTPVKDPMASVFAMRRDTFDRGQGLSPVAYRIALELIVKCGCTHILEVPIHVHRRSRTGSRLTLREQVEYFRHLKRLYEFKFGRAARPLQFGLVGASGAVVDLLSLKILLAFLAFPWARALAIWIAMTWNFFFNRRLTFSYARTQAVLPQYWKYVVSCCLGVTVSWAVSTALWTYLADLVFSPLIAAAIGILAGMAFNYTLSATLVFRR